MPGHIKVSRFHPWTGCERFFRKLRHAARRLGGRIIMRLLAQGSRQHRSPTDPGIHLVLAVHQTCADRRGAAARRLHGVCPRTEGGHALSLSFCRLLTRRQQVAFRRLKHGLSIELGLAATTGQQRQRPPSPWPTARGEKLHGRARQSSYSSLFQVCALPASRHESTPARHREVLQPSGVQARRLEVPTAVGFTCCGHRRGI